MSDAQGRYLRILAVGLVAAASSATFNVTAFASNAPPARRLVVFTQYTDNGAGEDPNATLYVAQLGSRSARRLTEPCPDCSDDGRWSPDGKTLAFEGVGDADSEGGIFLIRPDGTGRRRLCGLPTQRDYHCSEYPTWSPDGSEIAFSLSGGGIGIERLDRSAFRRVPHTGSYGIWGLDWSPDGKTLAFDPNLSAVDVIAVRGTGARRLFPVEPDAAGPRWSPDGTRLLFGSGDGQRLSIATTAGRILDVLKLRTDSAGWWDSTHVLYAARDGLHVYDLVEHRAQDVFPLPAVCRGRGHYCGSFEVQPTLRR
jgi:Tol biopolymer transport system component